jgi:hypothetical protein
MASYASILQQIGEQTWLTNRCSGWEQASGTISSDRIRKPTDPRRVSSSEIEARAGAWVDGSKIL